MDDHPGSLAGNSNSSSAYEWTVEAINLLDMLSDALTKLGRSWGRFYIDDNGWSYFSDLDEPRLIDKFHNVKMTFERLKGYQEELQDLRESVNSYSGTVSYNIQLNR
jgi:hypothetical protein